MMLLPVALQAVSVAGLVLLLRKGHTIMANLQDLKAAIAAVAKGVDGLEEAITGLKAQLAAGGAVTQADLDELFASVQAIGADIADPSDQGA